MKRNCEFSFQRLQRGSALIISLIFLLLLTIVGVASMRSATLQERMAGNVRDRGVAFQAAEAALRQAEDVLSAAVIPVFNNSQVGFRPPVDNSGSATYWFENYDWGDVAGADAGSEEYAGALEPVSDAPRYVVEELPAIVEAGQSVKLGQLDEAGYYRITARATGVTTDTTVILQSVYKR